MRLLYTTEYSGPNICGVWNRVKAEGRWMHAQGHEVFIFSTNINKNGGRLPHYEWMDESMHCFRFKPMFRLSENASWWAGGRFKEYLLKIKPDIIICNTYRHLETTEALDISKRLNIPCVLVTHAPFLKPGIRSRGLSIAAWLYDKLCCRLNEFSKIFAISNWELPYLQKLGAKEIAYVPNAIPDEMFQKANIHSKNRTILFLGRIAPIKDLPTLLRAMTATEYQNKLTIAGPFDKDYRDYLVRMMDDLGIQEQTCFTGSIDNLKDKIQLIKEHDLFILPSKREGMPQALLEAMALGRICISSNNQGAKEIIEDGINGFLFEVGNIEHLRDIIDKVNSMKSDELNRISAAARKTAEQFKASSIYSMTEKAYGQIIEGYNKNRADLIAERR
jgi:galacturonosyltransferase